MPFIDKTIYMAGCHHDNPAFEPNIELLSRQRLRVSDGSYTYRVLVDDKHIKHVKAHESASQSPEELNDLFKSVWRAGDWVTAVLYENGSSVDCSVCSGGPLLGELAWLDHPTSSPASGFHSRVVDHFELAVIDRIGPNQQLVSCPQAPGCPLVYKSAVVQENGHLERQETMAYERLQRATDECVAAPVFFAHVRMQDQIVGYLLEHIPSCPPCTTDEKDVKACLEAVEHLQGVGLSHGNITRASVRIRADGDGKPLQYGPDLKHKAFFVDFETARKAGSWDDMDEELRQMQEVLEVTPEMQEELALMW